MLIARLERATAKGQTRRVETTEAELEMPPFPRALAYIWRAYGRLRRRKAPGFNGHVQIEWPDIDSFIRRSGTSLAPWEIGLIEDIDDIFLAAQRDGDGSAGKDVVAASKSKDAAGVKEILGALGTRKTVVRKKK